MPKTADEYYEEFKETIECIESDLVELRCEIDDAISRAAWAGKFKKMRPEQLQKISKRLLQLKTYLSERDI